jgi:cyclase
MRMPTQQLARYHIDDGVEIKQAGFLAQPRIEHHLEHKIAELISQMAMVTALYRIDYFVYLFQRMRRDAGEILLNCIDRDGSMSGYDLEMAQRVAAAVPVPVIVAGGAGNFMHLAELLRDTDASAAACASLFHFGDNNPIRARSYLRNLNIPMRVLK